MAFSGSDSYYAHMGMTGSGNNSIQQESPPAFYPFQSQARGSSSIGQALPVENSSSLSAHGVNVGSALSGMPRGVGGEVVRRKRGRPRKYGSDSKVSSAMVVSSPLSTHVSSSSTPTLKRGRGRPPGTGRKHQLSSFGGWLSSSAGIGFTPHVITVSIGEDIATKIISFSQQGPRAICVLTANGSVSTATLRQPSSNGTITYEGRFEILCLSGSFLLTADSASFSRAGGLSVTLASPDGRVIGGGVGGVLRAASPIQVIVGSFLSGSLKGKQGEDDQSTEEPDRQAIEEDVFTANIQPNQNFMSTSSMGIWSSSHQDHVQTAHADIDLMH